MKVMPSRTRLILYFTTGTRLSSITMCVYEASGDIYLLTTLDENRCLVGGS
jgi:hypothetical protein